MKHTLLFSAFLALFGCSGQTLDGGGGQQQPPPANAGTQNAGTQIADAPASGTVAGNAFEPKTVFVYFSKRESQWFFTMQSYETNCGSFGESATTPDLSKEMVVNVGKVEPKAGEMSIAYADGHGASFQIGVFETGRQAKTYIIQDGTLRFDSWDETAGSQITGALKLVSDDGQIEGTFTAKVCAPRG